MGDEISLKGLLAQSNAAHSEDGWRAWWQHNPLLQRYPVLVLLIQPYAAQDQWTDEQSMACCALSSVEAILGLIELDATASVLAILDKAQGLVSPDQLIGYTPHQRARLYRFFQLDLPSQIKDSAIPQDVDTLMDLAQLLVEYPAFANARFIQRNASTMCLSWAQFQLAVIKQTAKRLQLSAIDAKIRRCRHHKDLRLLQTRLEHRHHDAIVAALEAVDLDDLAAVIEALLVLLGPFERQTLESYWYERYQPAPLPDTADIIQLTTYAALFMESHRQHHCAVSFHAELQTGDYAIFQVLRPERATLALKRHRKKPGYRIDQLVLKDNQDVSVKTRRAVKRWLKEVQK